MSPILAPCGEVSPASHVRWREDFSFEVVDDAVGFVSTESGAKWSKIIDELLALRNLEDNWDGCGTIAPPPAVVDRAIQFVELLRKAGSRPPSCVAPGVDATICIEWYSPEGYTEIEILSPSTGELRYLPKGDAPAQIYPISF